MLEGPMFSDFRFKGMQAFSYQYIKSFFFELLYQDLEMESFYWVKNYNLNPHWTILITMQPLFIFHKFIQLFIFLT